MSAPLSRSCVTASPATAIAARKGHRLPASDRTAVPATATAPAVAATTRPGAPTAPDGPATSTPTAASIIRGASHRHAVAPRRCGSPRTPPARSSSMSGSTLTKCAPTPSRAPAVTAHQAGQGREARPRVTKAGSEAKPRAYGSGDRTVPLRPRLYAQPPAATPARCTAAARPPLSKESGTQTSSAVPAAAATTRGGRAPPASGLSRRPAAVSRCASIASLHHPTESCPASTAAATAAQPPGPRPTDTASAVAKSVTATAGSGWQERSNTVSRCVARREAAEGYRDTGARYSPFRT